MITKSSQKSKKADKNGGGEGMAEWRSGTGSAVVVDILVCHRAGEDAPGVLHHPIRRGVSAWRPLPPSPTDSGWERGWKLTENAVKHA